VLSLSSKAKNEGGCEESFLCLAILLSLTALSSWTPQTSKNLFHAMFQMEILNLEFSLTEDS
jgi:hypothetical protein